MTDDPRDPLIGNAHEKRRRRSRSGRTAALLLCVGVGLYVMSYFCLSRWSAHITADDNLPGFFYVPCGTITIVEDRSLQAVHYALAWFFHPICELDQRIFGGPGPCYIPMRAVGKTETQDLES